ncbi:MAG: tpl protein [Eggerthellaceae bacterium]|nr:tpl protein [Eggerthellaceae bacterium]
MVRIAPVALQYNPRTLWFDPGDLEIADGDQVIVKTERGTDYGRAKGIIEVDESELARLKSKLKPVVRVATEEDLEKIEELRQLGRDALPIFREMAADSNPDMHPVMVEYLFEGDRAVFFFEAEERIDFRDLVRKLASELHVRVDMRQIGVRDEARLVGGLGHCGQELCCRRMGCEFKPVSIRMAKEQDLSLNPQKISGVCGRLMCCLRYEFDAYKDFKSRAPKQNAKISTPQGCAKVTSLNVPKEEVTVRLEDGDGKQVTFPLSAMDPVPEDAESKRPKSIGDVFDEYANPDPFASSVGLASFDTAGFTTEDKLAKPEAHHNPQRMKKHEEESSESGTRKRRRRSRGRGKGSSSSQEKQSRGNASEKQSRGGNCNKQESSRKKNSSQEGKQAKSSSRKPRTRSGNGGSQGKPRPGQKSSALSQSRDAKGQGGQQKQGGGTHRRSRRRSHTSGGESNE